MRAMRANSAKPVVAIGSIMHESNSFNAEPTDLADFHYRGDLEDWSRGNTEVTGFIEGAEPGGFDIALTVYTGATPKGPVAAEAFEEITARLVESLRAVPHIDGVLLALHGAMYSEAFPHADEEIVRRVRALLRPGIPLVVTHDFHANISPELVAMTDVLVTYQQCPHLDTRQRGALAASILGRMLSGEVHPRQAIVKPPMLWTIPFHNTYEEPLQSITRASIELEKQPGILAASVACGYQYNDVPYIGPSVIVVTDGDAERAQKEAQRLADMMWDRRETTRLTLPDAAAAVTSAIKEDRFPVSLFDVGDNVGGGSPGDETTLLGEFLRQRARGWVVALFDPEAVAAAKSAGIDGVFDREVGGKSASTASKPVRVKGTVQSLHHGRFIEPEVRHGGHRFWDMGHAAVIAEDHSTADDLNILIVTSERCCPFSLHQLISCGVYPNRQKILTAKGTVAPRAAYEPVSSKVVLVDTPGITSVNPKRFPFQRIRQGLWEFNN
jgi:microcystin degradation protein MlrC